MAEAEKALRRAVKRSRCAIYTRKSSEEGLDQDFNSLDAQRESCAAFVQSQKHEGWTILPAWYDDGGYSGGTMERPALQRLLADIEANRIGVVVVYKVDRRGSPLARHLRAPVVLAMTATIARPSRTKRRVRGCQRRQGRLTPFSGCLDIGARPRSEQ
jgi:DNA invertase Pin-like site-specific DNA recombinase